MTPTRPAGIPLAQAGGLPPIKGATTTATSAAPSLDKSADLKAGLASPDLQQIIHPSVRDRWLTSQISMYTPAMIENIIRGAMGGNLVAQWQMFDLMERTWPRLSKNLNELKTAVIGLGWNLQPFAMKGNKPTPEAQRRKRVIEQMLWTMRPDLERDENDFEDTLRDVMDAAGKGISMLQVIYEQRPINVSLDVKKSQMAKLWCPRATQYTHPRYYGYPSGSTITDDRLMLNAREVRQNNPGIQLNMVDGDWAEIPKDQFIVSIFKQKSGHPLNASLLAILGYWWSAQNFTWDWFLNFSQMFGMPIRWATYAPGVPNQTITQILDMLQQMGNMAYGAFPAGTNLELKTGATDARNVPHKVLIDAADTICDVLILGQTSSTQVSHGGGLGSGHAAALQGDVRQEKIMGVAKRTAKVLNVTLLPALCRLNFGDDSECPQLVPADTKGKDLLTVAQRYQIILSTPGVKISKAQYFEDNDLIQPDEDDEVLVAMAQSAPGGKSKLGEDPNDPSTLDRLDNAQGRLAEHHCNHARAKAPADQAIVNAALEELTGVSEKWLGGVKPFFHELLAKAKSGDVTDAEFAAALKKAQAQIPELFHQLDHQALAHSLENAMSAAAVNGVARGYMDRKAVAK
jgi:phage gp29-like protein